jgi:DNA mismatch endonuclease (patch repair protein)
VSRDPKVTSRIMSAVRNRDTAPELLLRRELHRRGLRYRVHTGLLGRPDIVFTRARTAVFVDGDYWHGNTWRVRGATSFEAYYGRGDNGGFWLEKIRRNMDRDAAVAAGLRDQGWRVVRLWESDVLADLPACADRIQRLVRTDKPDIAQRVAT